VFAARNAMRAQPSPAVDNLSSSPERLMRAVIAVAFVGILGALAAALVFLLRDRGGTNRMVNALTIRIGLSVALFLFILFSYWMGWIEPHRY
jgi:hypothetical protein